SGTRGVQDDSAASRLHVRDRGSTAVDHTADIHVENPLVQLVRGVLESGERLRDARVVEQNVELAELAHRDVDHLVHFGGARYVDLNSHGATARGTHLLGGRVRIPQVSGHYTGALACER